MIKITDIEALLNSPHEMDITYYGIGVSFMREVAKIYGDGEVLENKETGYHYTFKNGDVSISLVSRSYASSTLSNSFPDLNLNFLNIRH